jgi:thiamine-phosphate diphosphorylase
VEIERPIICLVTNGLADAAGTLLRVREAAAAGVDLIQIREPGLPDRALLNLTRRACDAARDSRARIVVNDRLDVALAAGAHGIHLRGSSFSASRVRARAGETFLIGRSVHQLEEAMAAEREGGCDYLFFGTVFPSPSKPEGHRIAGLDALREACDRVSVPVVAIGGITRERAGAVCAAGAAGIAAIRLFDDVGGIGSTVEFVRRSFDT